MKLDDRSVANRFVREIKLVPAARIENAKGG